MAYGYTDTQWKDLLTSYDGREIEYDAIGNPVSYYNGNTYTLTWSHGRQLTQLSKQQTISPLVATYTYDDSGLRTSKTVGSTKTEYYWNGSQLVGQKQGSSVLQFLYDGGGQLYGFLYNGTPYYYVYNGQGDVVRVLDQYGETEVIYTYDAWGKQLSQKDTAGSSIPSYAASDIANINPIRYRGYYYDIESGFYYLQSRYYDPTTGRFINADGYVSTGQGFTGTNMFAYCGNNPVCRSDPEGHLFGLIVGGILLVGILFGCTADSPQTVEAHEAPKKAAAREKYNENTVNVYETGVGSPQQDKVNIEIMPNNIKPGTDKPDPNILVHDSYLIEDKYEIEAIVDVIMSNELYDSAVFTRTKDSYIGEWVAHNIFYNLSGWDLFGLQDRFASADLNERDGWIKWEFLA